MVRIFKVKAQEERRKVLVALSGEYRQALRVELAEIRSSAQNKLSLAHLLSNFVKTAAPVVGAFWGRKRAANGSGGFLSRLFSGFKFAAELMGIFKKLGPDEPELERRVRETTL